jgi:UV DNA damage endonuclease
MRLGYACINTELRAKGIFCSRSCTLATLKLRGVPYLKELALQNIIDLLTILQWNEAHNIRLFRITSNLFPHMGNPQVQIEDPYFTGDMHFAYKALDRVGAYAREHGHRLTFHMTPYIQLGSPNEDIATRSIFDVKIYGKILARVGDASSCIILHGGGVYDDKPGTLRRWLRRFRKLPEATQKLVACENDERHYGVSDMLEFCEQNHIRFCLDVFHNKISANHVELTPIILRRTIATWHGVTPKFHISDQDPELGFGAHAMYVATIPDIIKKIKKLDVMIEAKIKEKAVQRLYTKFPDLNK